MNRLRLDSSPSLATLSVNDNNDSNDNDSNDDDDNNNNNNKRIAPEVWRVERAIRCAD